jgi:riboflavin kinase/FMN adenylyltransferase
LRLNNDIKSIAIGSFDGIHIAHQALIDHADALVIIERNGGYLTPGFKRSQFTSKVCCFYHFDVIKGLTPEAFVGKLQTDFPELEQIVVGYDFVFGKNRAGNTKVLQSLFDGRVKVVEEVSLEGVSVHSRTIKQYLKDGNILWANKLLGREHLIEGKVVKGQGLGKKELVATLNLNVTEYQLPLEGVYATRTFIRGEWLDSVSFLGHRVSTDGSFAIETHIIETDIGVVEGRVMFKLVEYIRANKKFDGLEGLKKQIVDDIIKAKLIFR